MDLLVPFLAVLAQIALSLLSLVGLVLVPIGLPGNWLLVLCALAGPAFGVPWSVFWVVLGAAVVAEALEFLSALLLARRYGAGRAGGWGALLGGLVGALLGTPLVPPVGILAGGAAGAFAGAVLVEWGWSGKAGREGLRAGKGAFLGVLLGRAAKVGLTAFQAVWWLLALWTA